VTRRRRPAGRAAWTRITAIAGLAAVFQSCYFTAVSLTSVSLATLVTIGSAPVLVLAAERARGQRRTGRLAGCATGLALTGLGLLVGLPSGGFPRPRCWPAPAWRSSPAPGSPRSRWSAPGRSPAWTNLTATGLGFTLGGLVLLPVAAATGGIGFTPGPVTLGLLAALGTGPTAVAYTLYFRGLRRAPAGTAALLSLLEPLTGTLLAALILGDRLGPTGIAGAVILAAALVLAALAGPGGRVRPRPCGPRRWPSQHHRAQGCEHSERLPHGGAGQGAGRQHPGGGDRVVERVEMGQHPHPARPE